MKIIIKSKEALFGILLEKSKTEIIFMKILLLVDIVIIFSAAVVPQQKTVKQNTMIFSFWFHIIQIFVPKNTHSKQWSFDTQKNE
jgi:hypothetical protein